MFMKQIQNIASDCRTTHRWAKVNLTGDDAHNVHTSQRLDQLRVIGIGRKYVRCMRGNGKIVQVEPINVVQVW